jgi:diacylglycerol O-acyltransferase
MPDPSLPPSAVDVDYGALGWGESRTMSDFEAGMWRLEEHEPQLRSTIAVIEVLDTAPEWERLVAAHEWALGIVPRFQMRVVDPPFQLGKPVWAVDPEFDLGYHLQRVKLPEPGTFADAVALCRTVATRPFDRARPPWEGMLVEGLADGRALYLLKAHHSITDGMGGMQLVTLLHSRRREPTPGKPSSPRPPPEQLSPLEALRAQVIDQARTLPGTLAAGASRLARVAGRTAQNPGGTADEVLQFVQSLARMAAPLPAPPSPLMRERGLGRQFLTLEVTVDALRAAARAADGSINDAYIAALLGGYRRYHEKLGAPIGLLPMGMPINLRGGADPMGGNRFGVARFAAPVGMAHPADRIRRVRELVLDARAEPAVDILGLAAPLLARLPAAAVAHWYLAQTRQLDLQASNVAGIPVPVYMAGAQVTRMFPFAPAPGCGVMATLVSHTGMCCIGVTVDTAAVTEPELFRECLEEGLAEVLTLVPANGTTTAKKAARKRAEPRKAAPRKAAPRKPGAAPASGAGRKGRDDD